MHTNINADKQSHLYAYITFQQTLKSWPSGIAGSWSEFLCLLNISAIFTLHHHKKKNPEKGRGLQDDAEAEKCSTEKKKKGGYNQSDTSR
jgi:hypothetical protein